MVIIASHVVVSAQGLIAKDKTGMNRDPLDVINHLSCNYIHSLSTNIRSSLTARLSCYEQLVNVDFY